MGDDSTNVRGKRPIKKRVTPPILSSVDAATAYPQRDPVGVGPEGTTHMRSFTDACQLLNFGRSFIHPNNPFCRSQSVIGTASGGPRDIAIGTLARAASSSCSYASAAIMRTLFKKGLGVHYQRRFPVRLDQSGAGGRHHPLPAARMAIRPGREGWRAGADRGADGAGEAHPAGQTCKRGATTRAGWRLRACEHDGGRRHVARAAAQPRHAGASRAELRNGVVDASEGPRRRA